MTKQICNRNRARNRQAREEMLERRELSLRLQLALRTFAAVSSARGVVRQDETQSAAKDGTRKHGENDVFFIVRLRRAGLSSAAGSARLLNFIFD